MVTSEVQIGLFPEGRYKSGFPALRLPRSFTGRTGILLFWGRRIRPARQWFAGVLAF
jgi:hypothetical protein